MEPLLYSVLDSPLGRLMLVSRGPLLTRISFQMGTRPLAPGAGWYRDDRTLANAREQLEAYFQGRLRAFHLPMEPGGTAFQRLVWIELLRIPYGSTMSYGELARRMGRPGAARAVGNANGRNPIPIVIPCHRVVRSGGAIGGFSAGTRLKRALLDLESRHLAEDPARSLPDMDWKPAFR